MSNTPRDIGTLIVVILKARNLPNKRHIGKQDPYCTVSLNGETQRTRAIKRGGQHPEWDEEIRFTLYEDVEEEPKHSLSGDDTPPPPPPKNDKGIRKIKGGKSMLLSCWAEDNREPDLIGEATVDLSEALSKGETDEWFTLMHKDKYCGEVYIELTFWSNEAPPEKKSTINATQGNRQYGGPGSFVPLGDSPDDELGMQPRLSSSASMHETSRRESFSSSIRASSSLANLDLYVAPYEERTYKHASSVDNLTNDFGEFGMSHERRRESFPPLHSLSTSYSTSAAGFATFPNHRAQESYSDSASIYSYDQPATLTASNSQHRHTIPGTQGHLTYESPHDSHSSSGYNPRTGRGPRYSFPTSSSGFVPLPPPTPSNFASLPSNPSSFGLFQGGQAPIAAGYGPSHTGHPGGFAPMPILTPAPTGYVPLPTTTPAPMGFAPPAPPASAASFHPHHAFASSQTGYQFPQYATRPPSVAPVQQYMPVQSPVSPTHQQYHIFPQRAAPGPPPPPPPPPPLLSQTNISSIQGPHSRPLPPQPQGYAPSNAQNSLTYQNSGGSPQRTSAYGSVSGGQGFTNGSPYQAIPPPPPLPPPAPPQNAPLQLSSANSHPPNPVPPPPPPPSSQYQSNLPQPPTLHQNPSNYQQHQQQSSQYQHSAHSSPNFHHGQDLGQQTPSPPHLSAHQAYYPEPPPRTPTQGGPPQWLPPNGSIPPSMHSGYAQPGWH